MRIFIITSLLLHIYVLVKVVYRLGTDAYPHIDITTRGEAAFIILPLVVGFIAWAVYLLNC